jgi:hydroxypyruvate isomerase
MRKSGNGVSRRGLIKGAAAAAIGGAFAAPAVLRAAEDDPNWRVKNGRIKQSVVPWCFKMKIEELAEAAAKLGMASIELCSPNDFPILKKHGLTCAILGSHGFVKGFNHVENHEECSQKVIASIDAAKAFGCPNVITFSGMREKKTDEEGLKNCIDGLKKVIGHAEKSGVTLAIEMLNSRVSEEMKGHPGYQCDNLEFAKKVCDGVGSPRMKILFDFYHVQIMHGDVSVRTREYKDYIAHIHTAGVPGRAEIDDSQELNYPPLMKVLLEIGYTGFVGQEFIPRNADKIASLRHAVRLCDV